MIRIHLPAALETFAGAREVSVDAATVLDAVRALGKLHAGLPDKIISERLEPRPHVLIFVDDTEVRLLQGARTPLTGGETVRIVQAVSGG